MNATLTRFAQIDVLQKQASRPATLGVVLFHGFGADCYDLSSVAEAVGRPEIHWFFPQGPMEVPLGPHMTGRAWFPVDIMALDDAVRSGRTRELGDARPPGLDRARAMAMAMIEKLPLPKSQLIVGGFSQGAMLATELALSSHEPFRGLVILSGTLLDRKNWQAQAQKRPGFAYFQSHGTGDPVLPMELARELHQLLADAGWDGHLFEYRGGHEIPMNVVQQMTSFLRARSSQAPSKNG